MKIFALGTELRFFPVYLGSRDRESDHSGAAFKPGGAAESAPVGGREPALEPVALVAGVGGPVGLAQRGGRAQGHGRADAVGEVGAAGPEVLAERRQVPTNRMRCRGPAADELGETP